MIRLNCFFKLEEGAYQDALNAAKALTEASLKHEGCMAYDTFENATKKDEFIICETWKDKECLAKHAATPEFKEYVGIIEKNGTLKIDQFEF